MKKKVLVQFDGSNFYKKVKRILPQVHLTNFDYVGLAHSLTKDKSAPLCQSAKVIYQFKKTKY